MPSTTKANINWFKHSKEPVICIAVRCCRLKASLATMSAASLQRPTATPGGTQFELLLLALTARLSQWPQLERQAEQVCCRSLLVSTSRVQHQGDAWQYSFLRAGRRWIAQMIQLH